MAETVAFPSDGGQANGYLALPPRGRGPGLILVQEWWGLDPSLLEIADRLASEGFVTLVPDLFHGEIASHEEMDKAAQLMSALPPERAARDMSSAVDYLGDHPNVEGEMLGVIGFCMGGMLAWILAADRPDRIGVAVPFYGYPSGPSVPDWTELTATVRAHMAERDDFFPPDGARALEAELRGLGKDVSITVHPGAGHAFMNPHNAMGTTDLELAERIWSDLLPFLHRELG